MSRAGRDDDLEAMWQQAKPAIVERCDFVRRAVEAGTGTSDAAREAAHKLAGGIGMFGLPEASQLAQRLNRLIVNGGLDDERIDDAAALVDELSAAIRDDR